MGAYEKGNPVEVNAINTLEISIRAKPMTDIVLLNTDQEIERIHLYNIRGILVKEKWASKSIDVQNLGSEVYILKTFDFRKKQYIKKLIKC